MKRYLSVTIICILCILLCSCSPSARISLLESPFVCEVGWTVDGADFRAQVSCPKNRAGDFSLCMTYPPEAVGLSLEKQDGSISLYVNGKRSLSSPPRMWLYISEILLSSSPLIFSSRSSIDGTPVLCYTREAASWYFSVEDGRPLGFDDGSDFFEIIWIEGLQTPYENTDAYRQNGARRS